MSESQVVMRDVSAPVFHARLRFRLCCNGSCKLLDPLNEMG